MKSLISPNLINDLKVGKILGKCIFRFSDKPKLREAFILTSFSNPCLVKCSLFIINSTAFLNKM